MSEPLRCPPHRGANHKTSTLPGWTSDISSIRSFAQLPPEARRYVAFTMAEIVRLAARGGSLRSLPNLRYIGVGPDPDQIISDVPATAVLIKLA